VAGYAWYAPPRPNAIITLLGPDGVKERGAPAELRLYGEHQSSPVHTERVMGQEYGGIRTPDGHATLVVEEELRPEHYQFAAALLNHFVRPRFAIYTAPGVLRAVAPYPMAHRMPWDRTRLELTGVGISPDGHRIAYLMATAPGTYELRIYQWGKN
jgi:hypothetical protein